MRPSRHQIAQRLSRPLLHLISLGLVGAVIVSLFGVASFSLLNGSKEVVRGPEVGQAAIGADLSSSPNIAASSAVPPPSSQGARSPSADAAKLLSRSAPQDPPPSELAVAKSEGAPATDAPAPDRDRATAVAQTPPASSPEQRPADEAGGPGINETEQPSTGPVHPGDEPNPTLKEASQSPVPQTKTLISDRERDEMFHRFTMEEKRLSKGAENANPPSSIKKPVTQRERNGGSETSVLAHNTNLRYRVRRECGPIKDPALYHHCVARFGAISR